MVIGMSIFDNTKELQKLLSTVQNLSDKEGPPVCSLTVTGNSVSGGVCVWSNGIVEMLSLTEGETTNVVCGSLCCLLASDVSVEGLSLVQALSDGIQTLYVYQVTTGSGGEATVTVNA